MSAGSPQPSRSASSYCRADSGRCPARVRDAPAHRRGQRRDDEYGRPGADRMAENVGGGERGEPENGQPGRDPRAVTTQPDGEAGQSAAGEHDPAERARTAGHRDPEAGDEPAGGDRRGGNASGERRRDEKVARHRSMVTERRFARLSPGRALSRVARAHRARDRGGAVVPVRDHPRVGGLTRVPPRARRGGSPPQANRPDRAARRRRGRDPGGAEHPELGGAMPTSAWRPGPASGSTPPRTAAICCGAVTSRRRRTGTARRAHTTSSPPMASTATSSPAAEPGRAGCAPCSPR